MGMDANGNGQGQFDFTKLEDGEALQFGIAKHVKSSSVSLGGVNVSSSSEETKVGITDRRVIVEKSTGETVVLPIADVKSITMTRDKVMGAPIIQLVSLVTQTGRKVELGIGHIDPSREAELKALFGAAQVIEKKKSWLSFLGF
jgi:hypothetical protein